MDTKQQEYNQEIESIYKSFQLPPLLKRETNDLSFNEGLKIENKTLKELLSFRMTNQFQIVNQLTNTKNHRSNSMCSNDTIDFNRYTDILPYKHSAVKLQGNNEKEQYVNANYINCPFKDRVYIATQGPIQGTFQKFWQMVWENNTDLIVMLCKEKEQNKVKCDRYWPSEGQPLIFSSMSIHFVEQIRKPELSIIERKFVIKSKDAQREVTQVHWEGWPDHGVPEVQDYHILENLVSRVVNQFEQSKVPIVHCSAGVGRTGTLMALSNIYITLKYHYINKTPLDTIQLNVVDIVRRLREQRVIMVQMDNQLELVYNITKTFIRKLFRM